ncbi:MAG: hypothetical protein KIT09_15335 [Bryobacteraceae bacterium]|nr:hypothetical protein [Bryobacteraceae bacterium]
MTRRDLLRLALATPAGAWMARYEALAAPHEKQLKITAVKANMDFIRGKVKPGEPWWG